MYELSKKIRFESAHRLAKGYEGKCANIHGHSWNGEVFVVTPNLDERDFGIDFVDLGKFTKMVEEQFDHKILLQKDDPTAMFAHKQGFDYVLFEGNPTCETIAKWIFESAVRYFESVAPHVKVSHIVINETCTTGCKYSENVQG